MESTTTTPTPTPALVAAPIPAPDEVPLDSKARFVFISIFVLHAVEAALLTTFLALYWPARFDPSPDSPNATVCERGVVGYVVAFDVTIVVTIVNRILPWVLPNLLPETVMNRLTMLIGWPINAIYWIAILCIILSYLSALRTCCLVACFVAGESTDTRQIRHEPTGFSVNTVQFRERFEALPSFEFLKSAVRTAGATKGIVGEGKAGFGGKSKFMEEGGGVDNVELGEMEGGFLVADAAVRPAEVIPVHSTNVAVVEEGEEATLAAQTGAAKVAGDVVVLDPRIQLRDTICAICTCDFEDGETLRELPCGHDYHEECISTWILGDGVTNAKKHRECPLCKQKAL
ncbi:hypothetical protein HK101_004711 [Irineochytrium annulatum]|nr:hypothetical protein HK101_004711 [Irineochytrium annulatum]